MVGFQFQPSNFQFESFKSEQINFGHFFGTMSDFKVPGFRLQKKDEISEIDRNVPDAEGMSISALHRGPSNEGFAVLGTLVTMSSGPNPEWNHRRSKTWAFWANSRLLLNERVSLHRRLRVWSSCVALVFLWGLAALTPTVAMMRTIDICQREVVAKIMRCRRRPAELWLEKHVRTRRLAGRFLAQCHIQHPLNIALSLKR